MRKYLTSSEADITDKDLRAIEERFGIVFPCAYKRFLLNHNGGIAHSADPQFDDCLFFAVADTPASLTSAIFEEKDRDLIPIGSNLNEEMLRIRVSTGEVLLENAMVSREFDAFLRDYLMPVGE